MSIILSLIGIGMVIFALVTIYFGNKKIDDKERVLESYEVSLLEMKKNIEDLDRRVKESSVEKTKELEKLLKECDRRVIIFDNKLKEGHGLNAILEKTFEKVSEVKVETKPNFNIGFDEELEDEFEDEDFNYEEDILEISIAEILELYKNGKSLGEISEITGKSLEDIAVIMGM